MTNEQIEELRNKWESYGGKIIEGADSTEGFDAADFIESLSYSSSKTTEEIPES